MTAKSTYVVPKMDCPAEEQLIRLALEPLAGVDALGFDLEARRLTVVHGCPVEQVTERLVPLRLGAGLLATTEHAPRTAHPTDPASERRVLRRLLAINAVMFVVELGLGVVAESTGLIADSLDMLADASVYGISLYAVGRAVSAQQRAARSAGWLQLLLALGVLAEAGRRAWTGSEPVEWMMIGVAAVALAANVACIALLAKHREGGVHLRASWIFTATDALANLGVILAAMLVAATGSPIPDLVIGAIVGLLVLHSAVRILRLPRAENRS